MSKLHYLRCCFFLNNKYNKVKTALFFTPIFRFYFSSLHLSRSDPHSRTLTWSLLVARSNSEYCNFSLDGMLVHRRVTSQQYVAGTHLYTWVKRDKKVEGSFLSKETAQQCRYMYQPSLTLHVPTLQLKSPTHLPAHDHSSTIKTQCHTFFASHHHVTF